MHDHPRLFRLTASVAIAALLCETTRPLTAAAQPAPPPLPAPYQAQPDQNQADPPSRVGRLAGVSGTVSFHDQGESQWSPASVNFPVSAGSAFWTQPEAEAQIEISASRIALAPTTEFEIATLDPSGLQAVAAQGEAYLHLRDLAPDEAWSVQTPRGFIRLGGNGRYDIAVGSTDAPTLITVIDGSATIEGPNLSLALGAGQTATLTGTDNFQGNVGPAVRGPFLLARLQAERPPPNPAVHVPTEVARMPGGSDLANYGAWADAPDYGQVWYPQVAPGWVPYREGHWAFVAPWGWTWIDDAPWGFAPFHYGRWVQVGDRWAWTPGVLRPAEPPVYAPALVSFIGIGTGVALGAALAYHSVGWVPLGPREPYRPWYHASERYIRQMNVSHVTNFNNVTVNNFINRGGATAIPSATMTDSRPVQATGRPLRPPEFAAAQPIVGVQPLRPGPGTLGITPGVARQFNLPLASAVPTPGPAVRPAAPGPTGFAPPGVAQAGVAQAGVAQAGVMNPAPRPPFGVRPVPPAIVTQGIRPPNPVSPNGIPLNAVSPSGMDPNGMPRVIHPDQPGLRPGEPRPERPHFENHPATPLPQVQRAPSPAIGLVPQAPAVAPPPSVPLPQVQRVAPPPSVPPPQMLRAPPSGAPLPFVQRPAALPPAAPTPQVQHAAPPPRFIPPASVQAAPLPHAEPARPAAAPPPGARRMELR